MGVKFGGFGRKIVGNLGEATKGLTEKLACAVAAPSLPIMVGALVVCGGIAAVRQVKNRKRTDQSRPSQAQSSEVCASPGYKQLLLNLHFAHQKAAYCLRACLPAERRLPILQTSSSSNAKMPHSPAASSTSSSARAPAPEQSAPAQINSHPINDEPVTAPSAPVAQKADLVYSNQKENFSDMSNRGGDKSLASRRGVPPLDLSKVQRRGVPFG